MNRRYLRILIYVMAFLSWPWAAFAADHTYVCSDFNGVGGGATCVGSTISFPGDGDGYVLDTSGSHFTMTSGTTYYMTATVVTSGGAFSWCSMNAIENSDGKLETSSPDQSSLTIAGDSGSAEGILISDSGRDGSCNNSPLGSVTGQVISISDVCVTDTLGECAPPSPPGPPSFSYDTTTPGNVVVEAIASTSINLFADSLPFWKGWIGICIGLMAGFGVAFAVLYAFRKAAGL